VPRACLLAVDEQPDRPALCDAAAVVGELEPDLVRPRGDLALALDERFVEAEEVVTELRFASLS
jgi:hypothetical protein